MHTRTIPVTAILCLLLLVTSAAAVQAGELREIELTDGSVITGELVSLERGVYSIRSGSLGTITVEEAKVRTIRRPGAAPVGASAAADTQSLQMQMMQDPEIMRLIESLQNDPAFQKALEDPELMRAVNSGDVPALTSNPDFMKLLQHSTVRDIERKIGQ